MQTRVARALAAPGRACPALVLNYLSEEVWDLEDHLSWKHASRTPLIPSLRREECLDLTPRLLAENTEAPEALNPEYLRNQDSLGPRREVSGSENLFCLTSFNIPTVSPHCLRRRHCTCSARADSAEARIFAAGRFLLVSTTCFSQVPSCWCCIEKNSRY